MTKYEHRAERFQSVQDLDKLSAKGYEIVEIFDHRWDPNKEALTFSVLARKPVAQRS